MLCKATFNNLSPCYARLFFYQYLQCNLKCNKYYIASCKKIRNCMPYFEFINFGLWTLDCQSRESRSLCHTLMLINYGSWKVVAWTCYLNLTVRLRTARVVCVLYVTFFPSVKLPTQNHHGYIKENKTITCDIPRTNSQGLYMVYLTPRVVKPIG